MNLHRLHRFRFVVSSSSSPPKPLEATPPFRGTVPDLTWDGPKEGALGHKRSKVGECSPETPLVLRKGEAVLHKTEWLCCWEFSSSAETKLEELHGGFVGLSWEGVARLLEIQGYFQVLRCNCVVLPSRTLDANVHLPMSHFDGREGKS